MLKDILINVSAGGGPDPASDCGLTLAKTLGAHVTGSVFGIEPVAPVAYSDAVPGEVLSGLREAAKEGAREAAARFTKAAQNVGVEFDVQEIVGGFDGAMSAFARLSRVYDLTVVGQPNPDKLGMEIEFVETALFDSGRSVLIVPYIQKNPIQFNRVLVAWDGGRAATRAVAEARWLLARARQVEVIIVETRRPDPKAVPGSDLARHLARHNLKVELRRVLAPATDQIDETILNAVTDDGIDLVVMGGYGHSRLREFVLGGVTRSIIESMTVPVLMAH